MLQNKGESFGFLVEDLTYENSKSVLGESGKKIFKVKHKLDHYFVTIIQPIIGSDKVWIISEVKSQKDKCQPLLVGIGFKTEKVDKVFAELNGKLNPILSPEQFVENKYKSYCIDWYDFESLPVNIIEKLFQKEITKNFKLNNKDYWDLYYDAGRGVSFKYPKEFTNFKGIFGTPKLHFLELNNNSYLDRHGKWGVIDAYSTVIDNRKTFLVKSGMDSMWKRDEILGMVVRGRQESLLLKIPVGDQEIYLEYIYSYDPQSVNVNEKIGEYENIFMAILSTFKFIEKDETADWKIYKNKEYGFEVKYPNDLIIAEGDYNEKDVIFWKLNDYKFYIENKEEANIVPIYFSIIIDNIEEEEFVHWIDEKIEMVFQDEKEEAFVKPSEIEKKKISEIEFLQIHEPGHGIGIYHNIINKYNFVIDFSFHVYDLSKENEFHQILSTFKFIKK